MTIYLYKMATNHFIKVPIEIDSLRRDFLCTINKKIKENFKENKITESEYEQVLGYIKDNHLYIKSFTSLFAMQVLETNGNKVSTYQYKYIFNNYILVSWSAIWNGMKLQKSFDHSLKETLNKLGQ